MTNNNINDEMALHLRWTVTSLPLYSFELALLFNIALGVDSTSIETSSLTIDSVIVLKFLDNFESVSCESIRILNSHLVVTIVVGVMRLCVSLHRPLVFFFFLFSFDFASFSLLNQ